MASKLSKKDIDLLSAYKQKKETPKYHRGFKVCGITIRYADRSFRLYLFTLRYQIIN